MTIATGASTSAVSTTGVSSQQTGAVSTALSGSTFYVAISQFGASVIPINLPTDTAGNTYVRIGSQVTNGSSMAWDRFYCAGATGSATLKITGNASAGTNSIGVYFVEITGATASPLDQSSGAGGSGTVAPGSITISPSPNGELLISCMSAQDFTATIPFTAPSGFSILTSQTVGNNNQGNGALATDVVSASGAYNPAWTSPTGQFSAVILDSFSSPSPPIITAQPVAQIAASGATATFSVTATGATSYQWYSAPITSLYENVPGSWSSIGGATSSSYTTGTLSNSDNGTWYYCAVTNANGTTNTAAVRLWITAQSSSAKGLLLKSSWAQDYRYRRFSHTDGLARKTFNFGETDQIGYTLWTTYLLGTSTGNVTVALSGIRITSTFGTLKATSALALSGNHITFSDGILKLGIGPLLTGSRITSSAGSLSFKSALNLTGQKITFSPGTITASTGSTVTVSLTGQQITSVAGNLTANRALNLSGGRLTNTAGSLIAVHSLALTGQHATAGQGSLGVSRALALTGAKVISGGGTFIPGHAYLLSGQAVASASGTLIASQSSNVTVTLTGLRMTLTPGTVRASGGNAGKSFSAGFICNVGTLVMPNA